MIWGMEPVVIIRSTTGLQDKNEICETDFLNEGHTKSLDFGDTLSAVAIGGGGGLCIHC